MADADADLVLQSQNGSPAAFEALIRNHQRMVHSLTFRMTGSLADAEDLAQETFIRAYEQIGAFRGACEIFHLALPHRRQHLPELAAERSAAFSASCQLRRGNSPRNMQTAKFLPPKTNSQRGAGRAAETAGQTARRHRADDLRRPESCRGRAVLGCSETTVSWRVFAARRKLKRWLADNGGAR